MSDRLIKIIASFAVASGIIIAFVGLSMAYEVYIVRDAVAFAVVMLFVTIPGVILTIGGSVALIEPESEPMLFCASCRNNIAESGEWCGECVEYNTGRTIAEWQALTFQTEGRE